MEMHCCEKNVQENGTFSGKNGNSCIYTELFHEVIASKK